MKTKAEKKSFEQLNPLPTKKEVTQKRKAAAKHPDYELTTEASLRFVKNRDKDCPTSVPSPAKQMPKRPHVDSPLPKVQQPSKEVKFGGITFTKSIGRGYFCCQYCGLRHSAKSKKDPEEWLICSICRRAQHKLCIEIEKKCFCQVKKAKRKKK